MPDDYPPAKVDSGERYRLMADDLSEFVCNAARVHSDLLYRRPDPFFVLDTIVAPGGAS